jgi:hypothetical protein
LSLSFVEKKVTQNKRSAFAKQNVSSKETTPIKVDTALTGYPPVLIYSRELRTRFAQTGPRSFSLNKSKQEAVSKWGEEKIAITRLSLSLYGNNLPL